MAVERRRGKKGGERFFLLRKRGMGKGILDCSLLREKFQGGELKRGEEKLATTPTYSRKDKKDHLPT